MEENTLDTAQPDESVEPIEAAVVADTADTGHEETSAVAELIEQLSEPEPDMPTSTDAATEAPAQLDDDILKTLTSERAKERVKGFIAENRRLTEDMSALRQMVESSSATPEDLAWCLEYIRIARSGSEQDKRLAMEKLRDQYEWLAREVGEPTQSYSPLDAHPDLKAQIEDMRLAPELALEVARARRLRQVHEQERQSVVAQRNAHAQLQEQVASAVHSAEQYFATRQGEMDFKPKMARIAAHFADSANMQAFVSTYTAEQWLPALKLMYDSMGSLTAEKPRAQPIRSRPPAQGSPSTQGMDTRDMLSAHLDAMGI
ncbi:MAG: hypothetical protein LBK01_04230 [Burkholderiaceae bacterium]|jgi:hypothetical protein|nr:hypothetical protein [Burkholderiaceae bacterium]